MQRTERCDDKPKKERPRLEVADVLRAYGEACRERYVLTPEQRKVFWNLQACRTELLGGHLHICNGCGHTVPAFNSCRDRHCPKCQSLEQARWVLERMKRVLPAPYFHVVFTVPSELQPIARRNRAVFYGLLFKAASQTLLELGHDKGRLGATLGVTAVLHTWTRELHFFPHVHCIVTGGGLALDGSRWVRPRYEGKFLFPVFVLSKLFRGKFLALLSKAVERGGISLGTGQEADELDLERQAFRLLKDKLYRKKWVAYAKRPFAGPEQVFRYLGLYTHRVGISNHRLLSHEDGKVTFATKQGGTATVTGVEFIRRFLQHVLPKGFRKIRHYGLHAPSNVNTKLEKARQLLEAESCSPASASPEIPATWQELLERLIGANPTACPRCSDGVLIRYPIDPATGELLPPRIPEPDT